MQDELTERIAATVAPEVERAEYLYSRPANRSRLDVWDCFQRGMQFANEFTRESTARARELFEQAIELDSRYSQAYAGLAHTHHRDLFYGFTRSRDESVKSFFDAARKAVALDGTDSFAHQILCLAYLWADQQDLAIAEAQRAVELNPSNASAHTSLGIALSSAGEPENSIPHLERGLQLNPSHPRIHIYLTHLADAQLNASNFATAAEHARAAIAKHSDYVEAHIVLASALGHADMASEAKGALDVCFRLGADFADDEAPWRRYRSHGNLDHLFMGLYKAGLPA